MLNNNFQFTPANAVGVIPGQTGPVTADMLANLNNNNFGIQASPTGQQNLIQSLMFNAPTIDGTGMGKTGGFNLDGIGAIGNTLGSLGMLYNSFQQQKLAKESFNFQKDFANTNLANQTKSYNTTLEGTARARYFSEGGSQNDADAYFNKHKL